MKSRKSLIALRDLLDKLIDAEQSGDGEQANEYLPVVAAWPEVTMIRIKDVAAWPEVTMIRIKDVAIMKHTGRIPLFGIMPGERYVQLQLV